MKKSLLCGLLLLLMSAGAVCNAQSYTVKSPDRKVELTMNLSPDGAVTYQVAVGKETVIDASALGYGAQSLRVKGVEREKVNSVWEPVWGKRAVVPEQYNEMTISLDGSSFDMEITARAYNDGIAFRYTMPEGSPAEVSELTAYNFAGDYTAWYYNGERHNIGPEKLSETDGERLPVMTIKAAEDLYLAVHEADLREGEPLKLKSVEGERSFAVSAGPRSLRKGYQSAWRVILCGDHPGRLVDSHTIELLNPEPEGDFSWVKPGVALWDWRINGAEWEGFRYEMSYPSWVRMVDFAAEQGFAHLVLDANWYGPEFAKDSNPLKGDKAKDVQRLIQYGKEKGVGIWLYLNDVAGRNYPIEETLKQYGEWGASGVKYGFMVGSDEQKNLHTREITELCAKYRLLVDFHDYPVHPYGQMRTLPNAITREYCKAQLDGHDIFYPKTFVTSVFVNMIAGPLDMNNGMFDLRQGRTTRVDNNQEVPSTVVAEAARTLITFSGATVIPDIPEYYRKYPSLLRYLSAQQMPWRESRTLDGVIGEYIVMMRESKDGVYLVGAATNEEARTLSIPLSFLGKGKFKVEITEDGDEGHYLKNRETFKVSEREVTRRDVLEVKLAPGGGACIRITKL